MDRNPWRARAVRIAVVSVVVVVAAAAVAWFQGPPARTTADPAASDGPAPAQPVATAPQPVGGPFSLTDHTGQPVSDDDFRGRYMLVYFGFIFCPDICPTELSTMVRAIRALGPAGDEIVPMLITIDPARDTPEALANYVSLFDERLIGLTGTDAEIAEVADAYRVFYARVPSEADSEHYLMDHSAFVYLMGPDGQNVAVFPQGVGPDRMAEALAAEIGADLDAAAGS